MPLLTEEEANTLDDLLTKTTPKLTDVEGPFIKNYRQGMMVALDMLSAQYLQSRMLATKKTPTELISNLIQKEMAFIESTTSP